MIPLMPRQYAPVGFPVPRAAAVTLTAFMLAACNGDDGPKPPATIATVSGASSTGVVGEFAPDLLSVKVADAGGSPVGGVVVTFTVAEGGGSVTPTVDTTNNSGIAETRWRLGGSAGVQRVTAAIAGVTTTATFVATAAAGAPAAVAIQGGDNQSALAGATLTAAPSVIVRDRFNNVVAGTSVLFSVASGGGSITGAGATTNANGIATVGEWRLGAAAGTNRLQALVLSNGVTGNPITFTATGTAGTAAAAAAVGATSFTAVVGALVTPLPSIRVVDANGNPVANTSVTFVASAGSNVVGGTKTTNASGLATPDGWQLGSIAQNYTLTATAGTLTPVVFTATARNAAAAALTIVAGNNQTATVGRTLPIDPAVRISDAFGNPIVGQEVVFEVTAGGGSAVVRRPLTDANGTATVGAWTLGETPGANTLRATATGLTLTPVTFTATATAGAPAVFSATAGNNQSSVAGSLVAIAPSVVVRDNRGNPVAGVTVTFTPGVGSGTVTGGSVVTNALGQASVGSWRLGTTAGAQTLTASTAGLSDVVFQATATAGAAAALQVVGDSLLANFPVNSFVSPLPTLRVIDANGNPVAGAAVTFEAVTGTGNTLTGATITTAADGLAQVTTWRIGTVVGVYRIRAVVTGVTQAGLEPTWVVTGTALSAASVTVAVTSIQAQAAVAGAAVGTAPVVRVVDIYGNAVAGVTVTFTLGGGSGTIAGGAGPVVALTDVLGFAASGSWVMPTGSGARTLTATVTGTGITNNPVVFTATVP